MSNNQRVAQITYEEDQRGGPMRVRLAGRLIGRIHVVSGGWQYRTGKMRGDVFPTLRACKDSLERDEEEQ